MAIIHIQLTFDNINISLQVEDIVYYTYDGTLTGGFDSQVETAKTRRLGRVVSIDGNTITVEYDNTLTAPPPVGSYISFAKSQTVNTSSILGYYADVMFMNDSRKKAELFNVGSEITESSK